jgi:hypothetical protein
MSLFLLWAFMACCRGNLTFTLVVIVAVFDVDDDYVTE